MSATMTRRSGGELQRIRSLRALTLTAVAVAAIAVFGISPSRAWGASSYKVLECDGNPAPDAVFAGNVNESSWATSAIQGWADCGSNGRGLYLHPYYAHGGPLRASVTLTAPPTTHMESGGYIYDIGAHWWNGGTYSAGVYRNGALSAGQGSDAPNRGADSWSDCGWCTVIWLDVNCPVSYCVHNASRPDGTVDDWFYDYIAIRGINVTLVDSERPSLALGGSLFDNQVTHGTPGLRIDAADRGSGVETVIAEVNGVPVAVPPASCPGLSGDHAIQFRPCGDFRQAVGMDTTKAPWRDGRNSLRVCAADVATGPGVANRVCEQRTISVDNTCQDSQGATGQARSISAGLEDPQTGQLKRSRAVRSSDPAAIRGQLTGPGGPVKAASVCVYETVDEPAGIEQLLQVAKSTSTGHFGVEIPGGPSRVFRVVYRYNDRQLESPGMYLESSVKPFFKVKRKNLRNGKAVKFRGRIPGPNNGGRGVTMQAKVGKKWRTFKQLSTNANGHFKGKYRFTQTRGRVRYVFRALVKKQGGYPYSAGASRKRKVVVHG
ncbi:MAG: hypothetical protein WBQ41_00230 [Solirubrobacterales bacterium]